MICLKRIHPLCVSCIPVRFVVPKCIRALCHIDTDCLSVPFFPEMVDSFDGGMLLEVANHLMGGPGHAHHNNMERWRGNIELGKVLLWLEAEDVIRTPYQCACRVRQMSRYGCHVRLLELKKVLAGFNAKSGPTRERTACQDTQGTQAVASSGSEKVKIGQRTDIMWTLYRFRCMKSDTSGGYQKLRVRQHSRQLMEVLRCCCAWSFACI